jgi:hypothetical protein
MKRKNLPPVKKKLVIYVIYYNLTASKKGKEEGSCYKVICTLFSVCALIACFVLYFVFKQDKIVKWFMFGGILILEITTLFCNYLYLEGVATFCLTILFLVTNSLAFSCNSFGECIFGLILFMIFFITYVVVLYLKVYSKEKVEEVNEWFVSKGNYIKNTLATLFGKKEQDNVEQTNLNQGNNHGLENEIKVLESLAINVCNRAKDEIEKKVEDIIQNQLKI